MWYTRVPSLSAYVHQVLCAASYYIMSLQVTVLFVTTVEQERYFEENLNASKPSDHLLQGEKRLKA